MKIELTAADKELLLNLSYDAKCSVRRIDGRVPDGIRNRIYLPIQEDLRVSAISARLELYHLEKIVSSVNGKAVAGLIADSIDLIKEPFARETVLRNCAEIAERSKSTRITSDYLNLMKEARNDFGAKMLSENLSIIQHANPGVGQGRMICLMDKAAEFERELLIRPSLRDTRKTNQEPMRIGNFLKQAKRSIGNEDLYLVLKRNAKQQSLFEIRQMLKSERTVKNLMSSTGSVLDTPGTRTDWKVIEAGMYRYVMEATAPCKDVRETLSALSLIAAVADKTKSVDLTLMSCKFVEELAKKPAALRIASSFAADAIIPSRQYSDVNQTILESLCKISDMEELEKFAYKVAMQVRRHKETGIMELCDKVDRAQDSLRLIIRKDNPARIKR